MKDASAREPGDVTSDGALGEEPPPACCERNLDRVMCAVGVVPRMTVRAHRRAAVKWSHWGGACPQRNLAANPDYGRKRLRIVGAARIERAADLHEAEAAEDDPAILEDERL